MRTVAPRLSARMSVASVFAAGAVEQRHRIAHGETQDACRMMRGVGVELTTPPASCGDSATGLKNRGTPRR
jgi:hypothetical protein